MKLTLIAITAFGLEAVARREIEALGYQVEKTENGKVTYMGDERAIVRSNLWLRTADRVMLKMGEFRAEEPDDLFQTVMGMPWENLIPPDGKFTVLVSTVKSKLRSEPVNQKTVKKAIVCRLSEAYGIDHFPEDGPSYTVRLTLLKDTAVIAVDTSGEALHKRGYRTEAVPAPIKETLAAAMIQLTFWHPDRPLLDPCTGSGTLAIEAAMIGRNIAPGLSRHFAPEEWDLIPESLWKEERTTAYQAIDYSRELNITACDISSHACRAAEINAENAGVDEDIRVINTDMAAVLDPDRADISALPPSGIIIMNPPYGERIGDKKTQEKILKTVSGFFRARPDWSVFMITPDETVEKDWFKRPADRRRKLYNGHLKVCYYQFHGQRPERRQNG